MTRSYAFLIGSLAAIWGASYLFIKVAVRDFPPAAMIEIRLGGAGIVLALFLIADARQARRRRRVEGHGLGRLRDRGRQRRDPVHADRVGRAAHRLGDRRGRELDRADLQRVAGSVAAADREAVAPAARGRPDRVRRGDGAHARTAGRRLVVRRRDDGRRRRLALLRVGRDPRAAEPREHARAHARRRVDARRRRSPCFHSRCSTFPTTRRAGSPSPRSRR